MRHLASLSEIESALRRRKSVEQFLGGAIKDGVRRIRWLELRPESDAVALWCHEVEDIGHDGWLDIYDFPYADGDAPESPSARFESGTQAVAWAAKYYGASQRAWVNEAVVQDEYASFLQAGRQSVWRAETH